MSSKNDAKGKAANTRTVRFNIKRCDGPGQPSRWERFDVPVQSSSAGSGSANVISCLQWIAANPVTIEGRKTTPVSFDCGCLEEVCGACTMVINGQVRQSCSCLMDSCAPNDGDEVTLEPMSKFPVNRDLFVDRSRLFNDLERIRGWVPIDGTYDLGAGPRETPEQQQQRYKLSECMSCGCCLEACPQYTLEPDEKEWDHAFVGAAVISQTRYFNMHATGKELAKQRLDVMSGPGGVSDCGNAQNCVKVCPKEIPLTESIGSVGRQTTIHKIREFFMGR
ncbi:MAG: succinate dehydrogenase iron-sulfur subunit [Phycisphaeraceae bacterium]|nr:succinate dehydrogenase iron-sulfur subunit [Phycisphaerales bacterium]MCB9844208.1 succinate dehydrogenase iron-sulfur subunit [Phycisphaeraceae bacterium]